MDDYRIESTPPSMYYLPNFISEEEEAFILARIPANKWLSLSHRRLQAVPTRLTATNTLLASPLPDWLTRPVVERFNQFGIFEGTPHGVNHCLINEYLPGQGIMPHEDGAAYHPVVATVSLGGSLVLDVIEKKTGQDDANVKVAWRILQEPRSLLVTNGSAYTDTLHGIADITQDTELNSDTVTNWALLGDSEHFTSTGDVNTRTTRISLTYRDVKKVSTLGNKLFGKGRT